MSEDRINPNSIFDVYILKEEIGRGAFSICSLGIHKETGKKVAIKTIEKKNVGDEYKKNLETEMTILKKVNHPNIIKLEEMFETQDNLYLVMELITGGELFDRIVEKGCYSETEAATVVHKILDAIKYLHEQGICHRDLKPENLLLSSHNDDISVKIADFGLSKIISKKVMMQTACGTPGYVAPEVLNATGYGPEVDLWSIGVITYILLCGFPPFFGETIPELFEQILKGHYEYPDEYWSEISEEAKDFVDHLLVVDFKERYNCDQSLSHPWLKKSQVKTNKLKIGSQMKTFLTFQRKNSIKMQGEISEVQKNTNK
eukprot:TRINITY_DN8497_c0_g1_i1.p1 TRINITY_DN8497_c0_g1~~TRINITY_DN8497_c0_g1_i1.p1  ORF type:complete len:316 (-),score=79.65 TRINITY_DN8497_c0_g1_i1:59-1006(-)